MTLLTCWLERSRISGLARPLTGYGFGSEDKVFVDSYYWFQGDRPENSFVGMFLQLGLLGVLLLVAVVVLVLVPPLRLRFRERGGSTLAAATAGAVVAGVVTMVFQSYVYSVGDIGTLTFWLSAFLTAALLARPRSIIHG